jgi:hypothetical protein
LWWQVTSYGVSLTRLLVIALVFLVIGTVVFYTSDNTLVETKRTASGSKSDGETYPPESPGGEQDADSKEQSDAGWKADLRYRATYSLDQFLPLVNLHVDEKWEPDGPWVHAYAVFHATVGWLVVPLLVAAFAGIIKR